MKQEIVESTRNEMLVKIGKVESQDVVIVRFAPKAQITVLDYILKMEYKGSVILNQEQVEGLSMTKISGKWDFIEDRSLCFTAGKLWSSKEFIENILPDIDFIQVIKDPIQE